MKFEREEKRKEKELDASAIGLALR